MSPRYSTYHRELPDGSTFALEEREWLVLLVLFRARYDSLSRSLSVEEIARAAGVTRKHADALLVNLRLHNDVGKMVHRYRTDEDHPWYWTASFGNPTENQQGHWNWICEQIRVCRLRLRRARRSSSAPTQERVERDLDRVERIFHAGNLLGAQYTLKRQRLTAGYIARRVSPASRLRLRARATRLESDILMQRGDYARALGKISRILTLATIEAPVDVATMYGIAGAAHRMAGPVAYKHSYDSFVRGIEHARRHIAPSNRQHFDRWLHTHAGSAAARMGLLDRADRHLREATEYVDKQNDPDGWAEILMYSIRVALQRGHHEHAESLLSDVTRIEHRLSHWAQGWIPRYVADVILGDGPNDSISWSKNQRRIALEALELAWNRNPHYGFQQELILARLAALRVTWKEIEHWEGDMRLRVANTLGMPAPGDTVHNTFHDRQQELWEIIRASRGLTRSETWVHLT